MASVTDAAPVRRTSTLIADSKGADSTDIGPSGAVATDLSRCAARTDMARAGNPPGSLPALTELQVKAILVQMAFALTGNTYSAIDAYNRLGKYLIDPQLLVDKNYIKEDYYKTYGNKGQSAAIHKSASWTGKDSISTLQDFLQAQDVQEDLVYQSLSVNYDDMLRTGAIKTNDKPGTIMGMLFVAHMSSTAQAKQWRTTGLGQDPAGNKLSDYYALGRYAGSVLSSPTGIV